MLNYVKYIKIIEKILIYAYNNFYKQNFSLIALHYYFDYKIQIHTNKTSIFKSKDLKGISMKIKLHQ